MKKKLIGMEIGNYAAKFVWHQGGSIQCVSLMLPENLVSNGQISMTLSLREFLKDARKKLGIPRGEVSIVLSGRQLYCRRVYMPYIPQEQLLLNLPYEFRDYVANEADQFYYDYIVDRTVLDEEKKPTALELTAACVAKKTVDTYMEAFAGTGMRITCAIPREVAYINILRNIKQMQDSIVSVCFVDIGHQSTRVHFFHELSLTATRVIDIGGRNIDTAIAERNNTDIHTANTYKNTNYQEVLADDSCTELFNRIAIEIMKCVNFYYFNNPDKSLEKIYFLGGSSEIEALRQAVSRATSLPAVLISNLFQEKIVGQDVLSTALAYGAMIGGGDKK